MGELNDYFFYVCKQEIPGSAMIVCDNRNCSRGVWFCLESVEDDVPDGKWYCSESCERDAGEKKTKKQKKIYQWQKP